MIEKKILLQKIDEAIKSDKTSSENKKLLIGIKSELSTTKDKSKYWDLAVKLANIVGSLAKIFTSSG